MLLTRMLGSGSTVRALPREGRRDQAVRTPLAAILNRRTQTDARAVIPARQMRLGSAAATGLLDELRLHPLRSRRWGRRFRALRALGLETLSDLLRPHRPLVRLGQGLDSLHAELLEQAADLVLHRAVRLVQLEGDLLVTLAPSEVPEHLKLARRDRTPDGVRVDRWCSTVHPLGHHGRTSYSERPDRRACTRGGGSRVRLLRPGRSLHRWTRASAHSPSTRSDPAPEGLGRHWSGSGSLTRFFLGRGGLRGNTASMQNLQRLGQIPQVGERGQRQPEGDECCPPPRRGLDRERCDHPADDREQHEDELDLGTHWLPFRRLSPKQEQHQENDEDEDDHAAADIHRSASLSGCTCIGSSSQQQTEVHHHERDDGIGH
jgi:hypothetical protein